MTSKRLVYPIFPKHTQKLAVPMTKAQTRQSQSGRDSSKSWCVVEPIVLYHPMPTKKKVNESAPQSSQCSQPFKPTFIVCVSSCHQPSVATMGKLMQISIQRYAEHKNAYGEMRGCVKQGEREIETKKLKALIWADCLSK